MTKVSIILSITFLLCSCSNKMNIQRGDKPQAIKGRLIKGHLIKGQAIHFQQRHDAKERRKELRLITKVN